MNFHACGLQDSVQHGIVRVNQRVHDLVHDLQVCQEGDGQDDAGHRHQRTEETASDSRPTHVERDAPTDVLLFWYFFHSDCRCDSYG